MYCEIVLGQIFCAIGAKLYFNFMNMLLCQESLKVDQTGFDNFFTFKNYYWNLLAYGIRKTSSTNRSPYSCIIAFNRLPKMTIVHWIGKYYCTLTCQTCREFMKLTVYPTLFITKYRSTILLFTKMLAQFS